MVILILRENNLKNKFVDIRYFKLCTLLDLILISLKY